MFATRRHAVILLALLAAFDPASAAADLTVDAPASLEGTARRIRNVDLPLLGEALARAGLTLPSRIAITLMAEADARAASVPPWVVGLAFGLHDIVIFPERVLSYPYNSLESVVRHEITHLALTARARGEPLPRWFHEGVAISVDAGWGVSAQVRLLAAMLERPDAAALTRLFASSAESDVQRAYLLSAALVDDLRRRHGADVPGAVAARVTASTPFDRAFQLQTGETPDAAATRAWAGYLRWTVWIPTVTSGSAVWALILLLALAAFAARSRRRLRRRRQWDEEDGAT